MKKLFPIFVFIIFIIELELLVAMLITTNNSIFNTYFRQDKPILTVKKNIVPKKSEPKDNLISTEAETVEQPEKTKTTPTKSELKLAPEQIDYSHLPAIDQDTVKQWQKVEFENFSCDKMKNTNLSFVFLPLNYSDFETDFENQADFLLFSQYYFWAVMQEEPFKSYSSVIKPFINTQHWDSKQTPYKTLTKIVDDCNLTDDNRPLFVFAQDAKKTGLGSAYAIFATGAVTIKNPGYKKMLSSSKTSFLSYHHEPPHETGHAYAGFLDEYSQSNNNNTWLSDEFEYKDHRGILVRLADNETPFNKGEVVPSCPSLKKAKELWGDLVDSELNKDELPNLQIGYQAGCYSYKNLYKASNSSMMATATEFNLVQKRFLCKLLIKKTGKNLGVCKNFF